MHIVRVFRCCLDHCLLDIHAVFMSEDNVAVHTMKYPFGIENLNLGKSNVDTYSYSHKVSKLCNLTFIFTVTRTLTSKIHMMVHFHFMPCIFRKSKIIQAKYKLLWMRVTFVRSSIYHRFEDYSLRKSSLVYTLPTWLHINISVIYTLHLRVLFLPRWKMIRSLEGG